MTVNNKVELMYVTIPASSEIADRLPPDPVTRAKS